MTEVSKPKGHGKVAAYLLFSPLKFEKFIGASNSLLELRGCHVPGLESVQASIVQ